MWQSRLAPARRFVPHGETDPDPAPDRRTHQPGLAATVAALRQEHPQSERSAFTASSRFGAFRSIYRPFGRV